MDVISIVTDYEKCWDTTDAAGMPAHFAESGVYIPSGEEAVSGPAIADYATGVFASFQDARMPISRIFSEGNLVCAEWVFTGTMTADYGPFPATGKAVELPGAHVIEVGADGKLLYVASRWDRLLMLQQLGLT